MSAFKEADGFMPKAVSWYVLDAELVAIIKEYYFDAVTVDSDASNVDITTILTVLWQSMQNFVNATSKEA